MMGEERSQQKTPQVEFQEKERPNVLGPNLLGLQAAAFHSPVTPRSWTLLVSVSLKLPHSPGNP